MCITCPASAERLLVRTYTVADGLASSYISSLATDRDGFLWVCGRGGLSRFDGTSFTAILTESGLPHSSVTHFLQTRDGTRWVATNGGGIARLESHAASDGSVFTAFPVGSTDRSMNVNVLFESRDGALLAGTDGGLFRSRQADGDPAFEPVALEVSGTADNALQVWSLAEDRSGNQWVGTSAGLVRLGADGRVEHVPVKPLQSADHVWTIVPDDAGRLWLGHDLGLVVWFPSRSVARTSAAPKGSPLLDRAKPCAPPADGRTPVALPTASGQVCHWTPPASRGSLGLRVRPEVKTADGTIWLAYRYGLASFDGVRFHDYTEPEASPQWAPGTMVEDPGGDLWVKSSQGVARIARRGFIEYTTDDGLMERGVVRIFQGPEGGPLAVTQSSHIHRFDGSGWTAVRPNVPAEVGRGGRSRYGAVIVDRRGEWWVGSGNGLYRFPRVAAIEQLERIPPLAHYTTADGLASNDIARLYADTRGDLWIAGRVPVAAPLSRWHRQTGKFQQFGPAQGLPALDQIRGFAEDRSGALWVSTLGGLYRFDETRFHRLEENRGLPPGRIGASMHVDDGGSLWATAGNVPIRIADPTAAAPHISSFPAARNLSGEDYGVLTADAEGWIYLCSLRGLFRVRPDGVTYQELGLGPRFTGINDAFRDDTGTLWLATGHGILRYQPQPVRRGSPPPAWIGGVRIGGIARPVPPMGTAGLSLEGLTSGDRQVEIEYFGLGFGAAAPLRFQVRLDGLDRSWGEPMAHRSVLYAGLGAGRYRFEVRAVSTTGQVSARPATVVFVIPPPIWRRPWFMTLAGAALVALLVAAHRGRVRRLLHLERVRTRIAADLHDDLGASLARVSLLAEAAQRKLDESPEAAVSMLTEIGETSRDLVAAAGDIAYSIDPGRVHLDGLVARVRRFAQDLLADAGIVWRIDVEGETSGVELTSDQRRHILAILKEGLHNAVRHGRPRHLSLILSVRGGSLSARLVDDGQGFASPIAGTEVEPPGGHGLRSMRQRARELGGQLRIESEPGAGTHLTLHVPL